MLRKKIIELLGGYMYEQTKTHIISVCFKKNGEYDMIYYEGNLMMRIKEKVFSITPPKGKKDGYIQISFDTPIE